MESKNFYYSISALIFVVGFNTMTGEIRKPLSLSAVGKHLVHGSMGYQKDIERGISYLEKDGSPSALFTIAETFFDENSIRDETIAKEYLLESAKSGCIDAIAECFALSIIGNLEKQSFLLDMTTENVSGSLAIYQGCNK